MSLRRLSVACLMAATVSWPALAGSRQMRWVMGTVWEIETAQPAPAAVEQAFGEIRRLDALLSHYKEDSALSRLNRQGHLHAPIELAELLARCQTYSQASQGAFDVTVGPLVEAWGFKHLDYRFPSADSLAAAGRVVGWSRISLDGRHVRLEPGTRVEFGAIGKGYALDRAMAILRRAGIERARIDAGGQHVVAGDWTIGIRHPRDPEALLGRLTVRDGWSVATSGDEERSFEHEGIRYGHVLDPRTGWPARHYPSVTVVAPSGELADMLATVAAVSGPTESRPMLARYQAEALWYGSDGSLIQTPGFAWEPATPPPGPAGT